MTGPVKGWSAYEKRSRTGYFPVFVSARRHIHKTGGARPSNGSTPASVCKTDTSVAWWLDSLPPRCQSVILRHKAAACATQERAGREAGPDQFPRQNAPPAWCFRSAIYGRFGHVLAPA